MTERMTPAWARLPSLLYLDSKIRRAGRLAREVYVYVVLRDAAHGGAGVPAAELELEQLEDWMQTPATECGQGLEAAIGKGLLERTDAGDVRVVYRMGERAAAAAPAAANTAPEQLAPPVQASPATSDDALMLGSLLVDYVQRNHPKRKLSENARAHRAELAARVFDEMIAGGTSHTELAAMLHWCQLDPVWREKVTTAGVFRRRWKAMQAARKKERSKATRKLAKKVDREGARVTLEALKEVA